MLKIFEKDFLEISDEASAVMSSCREGPGCRIERGPLGEIHHRDFHRDSCSI